MMIKLRGDELERKDMNVNEHERLSNYSVRHKEKEQHFYRCSTFNNHSRVFNKGYNSYPKMYVKHPLNL
jgi:hypothetical protein